jgi:hypothetical protein
LGEVFPKRSFAFPFMVRPNHPQNMMPSCRSAKMMNVAYRLKTRVILRDIGQQRAADAAYSSFSHQLPFVITPTGSPNQATLDFILRAKTTTNTGRTFDSNVITSSKQVIRSGSNETHQIRGSLSDSVASTQSSNTIEVLVRIDAIHNSTNNCKPVSKIIGKLIQVKFAASLLIRMPHDC